MRTLAPVAAATAAGAFLSNLSMRLVCPMGVQMSRAIGLDLHARWAYSLGMPTERRTHTARLHIRLTPEQDELIREAAERSGSTLTNWLRDRLLRAARQELGKR